MSAIIKTRIRKTSNLLVQDTYKIKNGKVIFGTTKVIKKIVPLKKRIKHRIVKNYKKVLNFIMNLKSKYHLLIGMKHERKSTKHYKKHVSLKERFFNHDRFDFKNIIFKVR